MEITDKMEQVRDQVRRHRAEDKREHLRRENLRLKTESRLLHDELRDERNDLGNLIQALERGANSVPRHRVRRLLTLSTVALGAYALGAKAGRQRYDAIRAFARKAMRNGRSTVEDIRERADDAIDEAQAMSSRLSETGLVLSETAKTIAEGRANGATLGDPSTPSRREA